MNYIVNNINTPKILDSGNYSFSGTINSLLT